MGRSPKKSQARRRYSNDRLGQIAQEQLGLFAESAELNKTVSSPDRDGWDFHFVVPRQAPIDGSSFFDSDPPLTAMFAQVKGTTRDEKRRAVKLSHWRHAATMAMPFFFIVLEFDAPPTPARLFVVHVDKELVEAVAKRLRLEGSKAKAAPPKLHKLTMDLVWTDADEVPCNPEGLRAALLQHAGADVRCYAEAKRSWWESAGAATVLNRLSLVFKGPHDDADRHLAEWALGLTESLKVDEFRRVEHRWGIPRSFEPTRDVTVCFGAPPSIGKAPVRISDRDGVEHVEFEADVFCNVSFVPHLPKTMWALRLRWGFLQIISRATSDAVTVQLTIPPNQPPLRLTDLATAARAIRLLSGPSKMRFTIPKYGDDREHTSELLRREGALRADGDLDVVKMLEAAEAASCLCALFGVPSGFSITPGELEKQAEELEEWRLAQTSEHVTAQIDALDQEGLVEGERASFLWFHSLTLGKYELISAAVVEGDVQFMETRARIHARPRYARRWVIDRRHRNAWGANDFPRLIDDLVRELEAQGKVCLIADKKIAASVNEVRSRRETQAAPTASVTLEATSRCNW